MVLRVEAELAVGAFAFVVGVPGTTSDQVHVGVILAGGGCPFPEVSVHVVHTVPAAALFFATAALGGLSVGVALVLLVAVTVAVAGVVLALAGGLPFGETTEVLAFLLAEACGLFLAHHVAREFVGLVGVFVGVYANGLAAERNGVGVLAANVIAGHVILGFFPCGAVAHGVHGVEEDGACLVVFNGLAGFLGVERVANREECFALDFFALDLELDGVVVAACRRCDFGDGRDLVGGANAVLDALFFKGIGTGLVEGRERVCDALQAVLASLVNGGKAVLDAVQAVAHVADAVAVHVVLEGCQGICDSQAVGDACTVGTELC